MTTMVTIFISTIRYHIVIVDRFSFPDPSARVAKGLRVVRDGARNECVTSKVKDKRDS